MKSKAQPWLRYLLGVLVWFLCYRVSWIVAISLAGLALSIVDPAVEHETLSTVTGTATYLVVGICIGWVGSFLARRGGLIEPSWWGPSLSAAVLIIATTLVTRSGEGENLLQLVLASLLALAPVFVGQSLATWRQSALANEAASI